MTEDYGKTWKNLVTKDIDGFGHVIEQDHVKKDLLFLGTEFGFYFSVNRGKEWIKWNSGFPTVPVRDLAVHPRDNDLIIGTHGRSVYILDDISFLRELDPAVFNKNAYLFKPADTYQFRTFGSSAYSTVGDAEFMGQNREPGVLITYYFNPPEKPEKDKKSGEKPMPEMMERGRGRRPGSAGKPKFKIEILDEKEKVIRELEIKPDKGINRITWDLRGTAPELPGMSSEPMGRRFSRGRRGLYVLPGTYTVRLPYGDTPLTHSIQVKPDPRYKMDMEVLKKNYDFSRKVELMMMRVFGAVAEIRQTQKTIQTVMELVKNADIKNKKELMDEAKALDEKLKALSEKVRPGSGRQGISDHSASLSSKIFMLYMEVANSFESLTQAAEVQMEKTKTSIEEFFAEYNKLFQTEVEAFKKHVVDSGVSLFKTFKPLSLN